MDLIQFLYISNILLEFRETAELDIEGHFILRNVYDDSISYDLVGAACKVLGMISSFF